MVDTINDTMNGLMAGLARLDVWVLLLLAVYLTWGVWARVLRQATHIGAWLWPTVRSKFLAVPEPGSPPVQAVLTPNASSSPRVEAPPRGSAESLSADASTTTIEAPNTGDYPSQFDILAVLIAAGTITTTKAYDLLGVTRGASERYQRARGALEEARLRLNGTVQYQELDEQRRSTGRYVRRRTNLRD